MAININKELSRIHTDRVCDRIPVVSSVTNLVDLFQKIHFRKVPQEVVAGDPLRYSVYIKQKSVGRCFLLLIPFLGNFIVGMHDVRMKKKAENLFEEGNSKNIHEGIHKIADSKGAIDAYTKAAKLGHIGAMVALAKLYQAENEPALAMEWFKRADVLGNPEAKVQVAQAEKKAAEAQKNAGDPNAAQVRMQRVAQKLEEAAEKGNKEAQVQLADMLVKGEGVVVSPEKAFELTKAAADQGDHVAQSNLGMMLYEGRGVQQDHKLAFEYFTKAATPPPTPLNFQGIGPKPVGNPHARYMMGWMYAAGEGVDKDPLKASVIAQTLKEENYSYGYYLVGYLHENGINGPINQEEAVKNYLIAKERGVPGALEALERLKVNIAEETEKAKKAADPDGLKAKYKEGFDAYQAGKFDEALNIFKGLLKDTNNTHRQALFMMGMMFAKGEGVNVNGDKAMRIAKKLIKLQSASGNYLKGYLLENGIGVPSSLPEAKRNYQIAARKGFELAKEALKRFK